MPYADPFIRHTLHWDLGNGEVATTRYHWAVSGGVLILDSDVVDGLRIRAVDLWTSLKDHYSPTCEFVGSVVQVIGVNGNITETEERFITGVPGTASGESLPFEVACVASLRTASASRSGRGRSYLPPMATDQIVAYGRLAGSVTADVVASLATYLSDLVVDGNTFFSVVASPTQSLLRPVLEVRCGDVLDAQRRRRWEQVEAYAIASV